MTVTRERSATGARVDDFDYTDNIRVNWGDPLLPGANAYITNISYGTFYWNRAVPNRQVHVCFHARRVNQAELSPVMFLLTEQGAATLVQLRASNTATDLIVAGVTQATTTTVFPLNAWAFIAVDAKIDPTAGWVIVYMNGVPILTFEGNTGNADIGRVFFAVAYDFHFVCEYTCLRMDNTSGEAKTVVSPPDRRFYYTNFSADGDATQFTPTGGGAHYTQVQDNSATTYVEAQSAALDDLWHVTPYTPPDGFTAAGVTLSVRVLRTDGVVDTTVTPISKLDGVVTKGTGSEIDLTTGYTWHQCNFPLDPSGNAWDLTKAQVGIRSSGDF